MVHSFNNFFSTCNVPGPVLPRAGVIGVGEPETFWHALRKEALLVDRWANAGVANFSVNGQMVGVSSSTPSPLLKSCHKQHIKWR